MSFNIRGCYHQGDGVNAWEHRAELNLRTVRAGGADLIGFQEVQAGNLEAYSALTEYDRELGLEYGYEPPWEHVPIYWKRDQFDLLDSGAFWLSETPEVFSRGWDGVCIRSATWVLLREHGTAAPLLHLNTHLDHRGERARLEGARLVLRRLGSIRPAGVPVVLTGDFNCTPGSEPYRLFQEAGYVDAFGSGAGSPEDWTFHGFTGEPLAGRIDWILTLGTSLRVRQYAVLRDADPPLYPSDHFPVLADLERAQEAPA